MSARHARLLALGPWGIAIPLVLGGLTIRSSLGAGTTILGSVPVGSGS